MVGLPKQNIAIIAHPGMDMVQKAAAFGAAAFLVTFLIFIWD